MTSNQQIMSDLRVAQESHHALELMTHYKGVPFVCSALVTRVEEEQVYLQVHDLSLAGMRPHSLVYLLGSDYFEPSSGRVASLDIAHDELALNNFSYMNSRIGERTIVRVEPVQSYPVVIQGFTGKKHSGELADISMSGLGMRLSASQYDPALKSAAEVHVELQMPDMQLRTAGLIVSAVRAGHDYRLSVRFAPDYQQKIDVFYYLVARRSEIAEELRQEYERQLQSSPPKVNHL